MYWTTVFPFSPMHLKNAEYTLDWNPHTLPSITLSTCGVNLDKRMLDKNLCVVDTKLMNLRTYHFTSWLYYFCCNSLTAWWFMPCHLCRAISTSIVPDSDISRSAVTSTPVHKTLFINAWCNPMWFIYKTPYLCNLQEVKNVMFQVELSWQQS
jgi:hypothetical protein